MIISYEQQNQLMNHYQLSHRSLESLGGGYDNRVFLLNHKYIVRISHEETTYNNEVNLLGSLSSLPLAIPGPIWLSDDKKVMSYPLLHGKHFSHDIFSQLSNKDQKANASLLASTLALVHRQIHNRHIAKIGLYAYDKGWVFANKLRQWSKDKHGLDKRIDHLLNQYNTYYTQPITTRGLLHNDLYENNILTDDNGRIVSIIDRGDVCFGDIHLDFMYLYHPHSMLFSLVCDEYEHITQTMLDRNFIMLCTQIFITTEYLCEPNTRHHYKNRIHHRQL